MLMDIQKSEFGSNTVGIPYITDLEIVQHDLSEATYMRRACRTAEKETVLEFYKISNPAISLTFCKFSNLHLTEIP